VIRVFSEAKRIGSRIIEIPSGPCPVNGHWQGHLFRGQRRTSEQSADEQVNEESVVMEQRAIGVGPELLSQRLQFDRAADQTRVYGDRPPRSVCL
jgi:hypothetical protein